MLYEIFSDVLFELRIVSQNSRTCGLPAHQGTAIEELPNNKQIMSALASGFELTYERSIPPLLQACKRLLGGKYPFLLSELWVHVPTCTPRLHCPAFTKVCMLGVKGSPKDPCKPKFVEDDSRMPLHHKMPPGACLLSS